MTNALTSGLLFGSTLKDERVSDAFSNQSVLLKFKAFEYAWTQALMNVGIVDERLGKSVLETIDKFEVDWQRVSDASDRDGLPVPELVRQMRTKLGEAEKSAVHTGATSQDVIDTAMMLICRDLINEFAERVASTVALLGRLNLEFGSNTIVGRTRMQSALPIKVSDRLKTWSSPLELQLERVPALISEIGVVQIGGPVGLRDLPDGKSDEIVRHVAEKLDLKSSSVWHTDRSRIIDCGHWLVQIAGTLGKIGQDFALMSQQGIEEIKFSGAGGSSAMPHKQNPVRAELIISLSRFAIGMQGILGQAKIHEQERSGASWALEWLVLPTMFEAVGAALGNANTLLNQVEEIG